MLSIHRSLGTTRRSRWGRILAGAALVIVPSMALTAGPASAASCVAFVGDSAERSHWASEWGTLRAPSKGDTYTGAATWYGNTFDKELWKGPIFRCPVGSSCSYAWGKTKSSTTQWSIGGSITAGTGYASKAVAAFVGSLVPNFGKSSTYTTTFTWTTSVASGQYAQPYQASKYTQEAGPILGAYVSPGSEGTPCTEVQARGTKHGYSADWQAGSRAADWRADVRQYDFASYYKWY